MKLSDLNKIIFFLIIYFNISSLKSDDTVDIWKKSKSDNEVSESINQNDNEIESSLINKNTITTNSIIQEQNYSENDNESLYGIWDPDTYNFELSMWSNTDGKSVEKIMLNDKLFMSYKDDCFSFVN